jgi:hypothetical protein
MMTVQKSAQKRLSKKLRVAGSLLLVSVGLAACGSQNTNIQAPAPVTVVTPAPAATPFGTQFAAQSFPPSFILDPVEPMAGGLAPISFTTDPVPVP